MLSTKKQTTQPPKPSVHGDSVAGFPNPHNPITTPPHNPITPKPHNPITPLLLLFIAIITLSCCKGQHKEVTADSSRSHNEKLETKDGMLYCLACEGCNDTFVVVIPTADLSRSPLRLNVFRAMKQRKVIGKLEAGDWCAVKLNEKDSTVADIVINMDLLKGKWVHKVMPTERENARAMILLEDPDANVDSIINSYMQPVERGFQLMRHGKADVIGSQYIGTISTEDNSTPVVYPASSQYVSWKVAYGQIILSESDSITDPANPDKKLKNLNCQHDTCDFVLLLKDSLQISYKGTISSYYRVKEE